MWLALDSSTLTLAVALLDGQRELVCLEHVSPPVQQSVALPQFLFDVLGRHGRSLSQIECLVTGLGPGSFTGLRIGLSTMKALSYAHSIPLVGVSSLHALACEVPSAKRVLSLATVKRGEVYCAEFERRDGECFQVRATESLTVAELATRVSADVVLCGPALNDCTDALLELGVPAQQLMPSPRVPSAFWLAKLAPKPAAFDLKALFALEPTYLRGSGAEENPKFPAPPGPAAQSRPKTELD